MSDRHSLLSDRPTTAACFDELGIPRPEWMKAVVRRQKEECMDQYYMDYDDAVAAGEIDLTKLSVEDYVIDRISSAIDHAHDSMDMER